MAFRFFRLGHTDHLGFGPYECASHSTLNFAGEVEHVESSLLRHLETYIDLNLGDNFKQGATRLGKASRRDVAYMSAETG